MVQQRSIVFSLFFGFLYAVLAYYYSSNLKLEGDTYEYYLFFMNIRENTFPLNFEYFSFVLMWIVDIFGLDFRAYLLINYLLWLPLIFVIFYKSLSGCNINIYYFLIGLTFLIPMFFENTSFVIRQMNGFLFFLYYVFIGGRLKFLFLFLSIASHMSSFIYFIFFNIFQRNFISLRFYFLIFSFFLWLFDFKGFLFKFFSVYVEGFSFERKLVAFGVEDYSINIKFILLNFIVIILFLLIDFKKIKSKKDEIIVVYIYINSLLYLILAENPVLANRVAFSSFFFIIPSILLVLRVLLSAKK